MVQCHRTDNLSLFEEVFPPSGIFHIGTYTVKSSPACQEWSSYFLHHLHSLSIYCSMPSSGAENIREVVPFQIGSSFIFPAGEKPTGFQVLLEPVARQGRGSQNVEQSLKGEK